MVADCLELSGSHLCAIFIAVEGTESNLVAEGVGEIANAAGEELTSRSIPSWC